MLFILLPAMLLPVEALALETATVKENASSYLYGVGVDQDYAQAYRLYCVAVLQGDSEAAYHLGWMYLNGKGIPRDDALATGWFQIAAERGDPQSRSILEDLLSNTVSAEDHNCPLRNNAPNRATIESWVKILAPVYGLDVNLLLAMIEVESRFDPHALSAKDARGLMQLLPATAIRFDVEDVWDPFENLMGGMAYLRWLLDQYEGDLGLSLAAYNAGEQIVDSYGGIPPYRETRNYVKAIYRIYRQSIQSTTQSSDGAAATFLSGDNIIQQKAVVLGRSYEQGGRAKLSRPRLMDTASRWH